MYQVQYYSYLEHKLNTVAKHVSLERALMLVHGSIGHCDEIDGFYSFSDNDGLIVWYIDREEVDE